MKILRAWPESDSIAGQRLRCHGLHVGGTGSTLDDGDEENDRYDAVANACLSFLGFGAMPPDPLSTGKAAFSLKNLPETSHEERLITLRKAESLLRQCADREKSGRSLIHMPWQNLPALRQVSPAPVMTTGPVTRRPCFWAVYMFAEIQIFTTQPMPHMPGRNTGQASPKMLGHHCWTRSVFR